MKPYLKSMVLLATGGLLYNLIEMVWLGWEVWNYSHMPGNILGQICPQYFVLWLPVSLAGIVLDDWLRYWWWDESRPHYRLFGWSGS